MEKKHTKHSYWSTGLCSFRPAKWPFLFDDDKCIKHHTLFALQNAHYYQVLLIFRISALFSLHKNLLSCVQMLIDGMAVVLFFILYYSGPDGVQKSTNITITKRDMKRVARRQKQMWNERTEIWWRKKTEKRTKQISKNPHKITFIMWNIAMPNMNVFFILCSKYYCGSRFWSIFIQTLRHEKKQQ